MDNNKAIQAWTPTELVAIPESAVEPSEIIIYAAATLSKRDTKAIIAGFDAGGYEMVSTFVWTKASGLLKRQIATLGMEFVGEMLGRQDLTEDSDPTLALADHEALALAEDLGMVTTTQSLRLKHAMQLVNHFVGLEEVDDAEDTMDYHEAVSLLKSCITSILGKPRFEAALKFADFRDRLSSTTLADTDPDIAAIVASPYFFMRTTVSVLLSLLKTSRGAEQEHTANNVIGVIPQLWDKLRGTERWQVGQCYAEVSSAGDTLASKSLKKALMLVRGFDYVPETLRSSTFTEAAAKVMSAHYAMNNFYKERAPMLALASLGSSIPMPALPKVMEAAVSVFVGNHYGHAWDAADVSKKILESISKRQWHYYFNECLVRDRTLLDKLSTSEKPTLRWAELLNTLAPLDLEFRDRHISSFIDTCHKAKANHTEEIHRLAKRLRTKSGQ